MKSQLSDTDGRMEAVEKSIAELDESVAHMVSQEGIQERLVEEIVDVPIPQVMEKTVEVAKHIPQEPVQSYTLEQIVDMPVPRIRKETGDRSFRKNEFLITSLSKPSTFPARRFRNKPLKSWKSSHGPAPRI